MAGVPWLQLKDLRQYFAIDLASISTVLERTNIF